MRHPGSVLELCKMAVRPELRRRGIGAALIAAAIDRARSMGARELYLRTDPVLRDAIRLYRRTGFRRIGRSPLAYCRMCRECITMKIDLARVT